MAKIFKLVCLIVTLALVLSLGAVLLPASPALAATYYVDIVNGDDSTGDGTSGTPWATITHALTNATVMADPNPVIIVADGTYSDSNGEVIPVAIDMQVTIQSVNGAEYTVIDGEDTYDPVVQIDPSVGNQVVLNGFTVQNADTGDTGILVGPVSGSTTSVTIGNCYVIDNADDGISIEYIEDSATVLIDHCIIDDNTGDGIVIGDGTDAVDNATLTIQYCDIYDDDTSGGANGDDGVDFEGDIINSSIINMYRNYFDDNGDDGIAFQDSIDDSEVYITESNASSNTSDGLYVYEMSINNGSTFEIFDVDFIGNGDEGIELGGIINSYVSLEDCIITDNGGQGIQVDGGEGDAMDNGTLTIDNCTADSNYYDGLDFLGNVVNGSTVTITNGSSFNSNGQSESDGDGIDFDGIGGSSTVTIEENEINDNFTVGIYLGNVYTNASVTIDHNEISGNLGEQGEGCGVKVDAMDDDNLVIVEDCNDIYDNVTHGIWNDSGYWIKANGNWWGHPSGPGGEGDGSGDRITDHVLASSWLEAPCGEEAEAEPPTADFTGDPLTGDAPHTVQFRDRSSDDVVEWWWGFGDGDTSYSRSPSHTYQNEGQYTVTLTVTNEDDLTDTKTRAVYILVEAGGFPANLVIRDIQIDPVYAEPRQAIGITAKVVNEGGAWGSDDIELFINGDFEQAFPVGLAAGTATPISFTVYKVPAGEYQVTIGNATATFYVMEEEQKGPSGYGPLDTGGIIAIIVIAIILVAGVILIFLFTRRPV